MKKIILISLLLLTSACNMPAESTPAPAVESPPTQTPPPTPEPASPTPAFTATPVPPTATPEPPPIYFTDEFDAASPYWQFLQTGGVSEPQASFQNGSLTFDISTADTWAVGIHDVHSYSNVFVRAKVSGTPSGSVGLICYYDEEAGWFEYNVSSDGQYSLLYGQWLAPGIAQYIPVTTGESVHVPAGVLDYELGMSCVENFVFMYANGSLVRRLDVTNYGLVEGRVGVTASSLKEAPVNIQFDWVSVGTE